MRHSIASSTASSDFERKLTERGIVKAKSQAMKLDQYLEDNSFEINFIFSSSAVRAKETFEYLSCLMEIEKTESKLTSLLYMAGLKELKKLFLDYNEEIKNCDTILVVAHNNGISKIASRLTDFSIYFDTASIAILSFEDNDILWNKALDYESNWELDYFIR